MKEADGFTRKIRETYYLSGGFVHWKRLSNPAENFVVFIPLRACTEVYLGASILDLIRCSHTVALKCICICSLKYILEYFQWWVSHLTGPLFIFFVIEHQPADGRLKKKCYHKHLCSYQLGWTDINNLPFGTHVSLLNWPLFFRRIQHDRQSWRFIYSSTLPYPE